MHCLSRKKWSQNHLAFCAPKVIVLVVCQVLISCKHKVTWFSSQDTVFIAYKLHKCIPPHKLVVNLNEGVSQRDVNQRRGI